MALQQQKFDFYDEESIIPCKPFVKWAGGKRQLIDKLKEKMPQSQDYRTYFEPFLGGGALFFAVQHKPSILLDINEELINAYKIIKNDVESLIKDLQQHENNKEYFYNIRRVDRTEEFATWSDIRRASRFIYLNKTAFNGLWRVNSKGQHNVPFGKYKNPKICDEKNLRVCSQVLSTVKVLRTGNYLEIEGMAQKDDFVYFDPPYHPLTETANFTSYAKDGFSGDDQIKLKELIDRLTAKGIKIMLSNSSAKLILDLYEKEYNLFLIDANRAINCKSDGRGPVKEVIVTNY